MHLPTQMGPKAQIGSGVVALVVAALMLVALVLSMIGH